MATRIVTRDELDDAIKRIVRFGTERITDIVPGDDGLLTIVTDRLVESKQEIR